MAKYKLITEDEEKPRKKFRLVEDGVPSRAGQRGGMVEQGTISRDAYMAERGGVGFGGRAVPQDVGTAPNGPMATRNDTGLLGMKPVLNKGLIKDVGATQRALETPQDMQTEKMSRLQSAALGVNDFNPLRLATGDRGYNAAMKQSLEDNPMTTRAGQGLALTAGGGAQAWNAGMKLAPKLVAPAVAARLAGDTLTKQGIRYAGRLATMTGLGAADYYAYNALAEAPNQARTGVSVVDPETGVRLTVMPSDKPPTAGERIDYANSRVFTPDGLLAAAIPGAGSVLARGARYGLASGKNAAQAVGAKVLPQAIPAPRQGITQTSKMTPADVQARVAGFSGQLRTMTNDDAGKAIDMLLKRGFDPDEAEKMVKFLDYAGKSEVPEMLFQLMPNLRRVDQLTVALGTVGGDAKEALAQALGKQAMESPAILRNALRKAMGISGEDFYAMQKGIQAEQLSAPREGYKAAYSKEVSDETWTGQILPQLRTKYGREAVSDAADYAEGLAGTDPAKLAVARQLAELRDALGSQGATPGKVSTQSLDYIDRMLGDMAQGLRQGTGRRELAKGPAGTQRAIRGGPDSGLDAETGLADPRRLSAELKSAEEALTFGRDAYKAGTDIETLLDEFAFEMTKLGKGGAESETVKGALLMGWLRGAEDDISKATNPQSVIRRLYGSERQREKLLAMMPELADDTASGLKGSNTKDVRALIGGKREDGREMAGMIDRLKRISGDYNRIIGNSQTAQRAAAVLEESGVGGKLGRLLDAALAPQRAAVDAAKAAINIATKPGIYQPGVNRELGRLLTARGKKQLLATINEIRARQIATGKGPKPPAGAPVPPRGTPPTGGAMPAGPVRGAGFIGFQAPAGSGKRPSGFLDDLERGTERFYDPRLGAEGSNANKAVEMAKNGYSNSEIAEALGQAEGAVRTALSRARALGIDIPKAMNPGGAAATETGSMADVLRLKSKGYTNAQIREATGKSPETIKVMLSKERKRLRDAGEEIPGWLSPEVARSNGLGALKADAGPAAIGGFIGFNQDGEPITADNIGTKLRNSLIGAGVGAAANRIPVRSLEAFEAGARRTVGKTRTAGVPKTGNKAMLPDHGYDELKIGQASVEVTRVGDQMTINRIKVPESARGRGEASKALDDVLRQADEQGLTVFLTADPIGAGGLSKSQLEAFYKRHGFVANKGKNKDFSSQAGMIRPPASRAQQAAKFETPGSPEWEAAKAKGLDMSQAGRQTRAKEQGYNTDEVLYHGTDRAGFDQFDVNAPARARSEGERAIFLTDKPAKASTFAGVENPSIMPLYVRGRIKTITPDDAAQLMIPGSRGQQMAYRSKDFARIIDQAKAEGFDGVRFKNVNEGAVGDQIAIFDPSNIRSVNAAFDPDKAASPILTAGLPIIGRPRGNMPKAKPPNHPKKLSNTRMGSSWREPEAAPSASAVAVRAAQRIARTRPNLNIGQAVAAPGRMVASGMRAVDRRLRAPEDPRLLQPAIASGQMKLPPSGSVPQTRPAIERMQNPGASADVLAGIQRRTERAYGAEKGEGVIPGRTERALDTLKKIEGYMNSVATRLDDLRARSPTDEGLALAIEARKVAAARYMQGMDELSRLIVDGAPAQQIAKVQQDVVALRDAMKAVIDKPKRAPGLAQLERIDAELTRAMQDASAATGIFGPSGRQIRSDNEVADLLTNPARAPDAAKVAQAKPLGSHEIKGQLAVWGGIGAAGAGMYVAGEKEKRERSEDYYAKRDAYNYENKDVPGITGERLAEIQRFLNYVAPGEAPLTEDGKMGPATKAAIKRYQEMRGLKANGLRTWQTIEDLEREMRAPEERGARTAQAQ